MFQRGNYPPFVVEKLGSCPQAGSGVHKYCFDLARNLHAHHSEGEIFEIIKESTADCGRFVPDSEIHNAIRDSKGCAWVPTKKTNSPATGAGSATPLPPAQPRPPRLPDFDIIAVHKIFEDASDTNPLRTLVDASPMKCCPEGASSISVLRALFNDDPLLCLGHPYKVGGRTLYKSETKPLSELVDETIFELIVPSPMSAPFGKVKSSGKLSPHTLDNTGPRTYLVIEFDTLGLAFQIPVIRFLEKLAPLTAVIYSGSKSLHAWFRCGGEDEETVRSFFKIAVRLGADPALWTRSQFARTPNALRLDKNYFQSVVYFNPSNTQGAWHECTPGIKTVWQRIKNPMGMILPGSPSQPDLSGFNIAAIEERTLAGLRWISCPERLNAAIRAQDSTGYK